MSRHRGAISPAVRSGVGVFSLSHPASGFHPIASELIPARNDVEGQQRSKNYDVIAAPAYCALRFVLPKLISGLRKPIAIQAAISFNMNLPE